jgi:hypothetical protein
MKNLLTILLLLLCFSGFSQEGTYITLSGRKIDSLFFKVGIVGPTYIQSYNGVNDTVIIQVNDSIFVKYQDSLTVFVTPDQLSDSLAAIPVIDTSQFVRYPDSLTVFVTPMQLADSTPWVQDPPDGIYYTAGKVAIGTSTFAGALNVNGNVGINNGTGNYSFGNNMSSLTAGSQYNVAFGVQNLNKETNGDYNIGIGILNFEDVVGGQSNQGFGRSNYPNLTIGSYNIAAGEFNGRLVTSSSLYNILLGYQNFYTATRTNWSYAYGYQNFYSFNGESIFNFAMGYQNFRSLLNGNNNYALGDSNYGGLTNGQYNVGMGKVYDDVTTSTGSIGIGYFVGNSTIATNALYTIGIGYLALNTASSLDSVIAIGYNAGSLNSYNGSILIGANAETTETAGVVVGPNASRFASGNYDFDVNQDTTGKAGQILTYNASLNQIELKPNSGPVIISEVNSNTVLSTLNVFLPVNVTSNTVEIDLPAGTPSSGDVLKITDSRANAGTNNITIDFISAGDNLHGSSQNAVLNLDGSTVTFTYINAAIGWVSE